MRKYKCMYNGSSGGLTMKRLTIGKVYDATPGEFNGIYIIDDQEITSFYYILDDDKEWFIDVTFEYRNEIIDDILT